MGIGDRGATSQRDDGGMGLEIVMISAIKDEASGRMSESELKDLRKLSKITWRCCKMPT